MSYPIQYEANPESKDIEILSQGILLNAQKKRGIAPAKPLILN